MNQTLVQQHTFTIRGMHCASCEVLIERAWKKLPGVTHVNVDHVQGQAVIQATRKLMCSELEHAVVGKGYTVHEESHTSSDERGKHYFEAGALVLLLVALYLFAKGLGIIPETFAVSHTMSYGAVLALGLVAGLSSCLAVTGGLVVALSATHQERNPNLTTLQKFKPQFAFNVGRLLSYTVLGGLIGALGSVFTLSPQMNGALTVVASVVMVVLGLRLLHIFPSLHRLHVRMPKRITHAVHNLSSRHSMGGAFALGAGTFFLPCGFTQALQLYVLSQGSASQGALMMLMFALGTLPTLLFVGVATGLAKGTVQRYALKLAGAVVLILGLMNIPSGFVAAGFTLPSFAQGNGDAEGALAPMENGKQVVNMTIRGLNYTPHRFTVRKGIPVEWRIDATRAVGCARIITIPALKLVKELFDDMNTITFTPQQEGELAFSCAMGMTTWNSAFNVIP